MRADIWKGEVWELCSSQICWTPLKLSLKKVLLPRRTLPSPAPSLLQTALPGPVGLTRGCRLLGFSFKAKLLMLFCPFKTKSYCFLTAAPVFWGQQRHVLELINNSANQDKSQLFITNRVEPDFQYICHGRLSLPENNWCFALVYESAHGFLHFSWLIRPLQFKLLSQ